MTSRVVRRLSLAALFVVHAAAAQTPARTPFALPPFEPTPPTVEEDLARAEQRALAEAPYVRDEREFRRALASIVKEHEARRRRGALPAHDVDASVEARLRAMTGRRDARNPGTRAVAAQHTQRAIALIQQGNQSFVASEQRWFFGSAFVEYAFAERAWQSYLEQDDLAEDAYGSRFWLADARYWQMQLSVSLDRSMPAADYGAALTALLDVRDSDEDDRFLEPAANHVTMLARMLLSERYRAHDRDDRSWFPELNDVRKLGSGTELKIDATPPPGRVRRMIAALDEYADRVPVRLDPQRNGPLFQYQAARHLFAYGQFAEAEPRLCRITQEGSSYAYRAFGTLRAIATFEADQTGDQTKLRELVANPPREVEEERLPDRPCPPPPADLAARFRRINTTIVYFFPDAAGCLQKAMHMPPGPERRTTWLWTASLYEAGLREGPARDEAAEAAINGALAFKQVDEYGRAIDLYRLFLPAYGNASILTRLADGTERNRQELAQRKRNTAAAGNELGAAYVMTFDLRRALDTFDAVAANVQLDPFGRRRAAGFAVWLGAMLDDPAAARAQRVHESLAPRAAERAILDFDIAATELSRWDPLAADAGENLERRRRAIASFERFYALHAHDKEQAPLLVRAAATLARLHSTDSKTAARWHDRVGVAFAAVRGTPVPYAGDEGRREQADLDHDASIATLVHQGTLAEGPRGTARVSAKDGARAVHHYTAAVALARTHGRAPPEIALALRRLAILADVLGDAAMRDGSRDVLGFSYRDGMWRNAAPGVSPDIDVSPLPPGVPGESRDVSPWRSSRLRFTDAVRPPWRAFQANTNASCRTFRQSTPRPRYHPAPMDRTLFSEEHLMYRDAFRTFLAREVVPHQERWRDEGMVDRDVWRKAGAAGFLCPWVAEEYGGAGGDFLYSVVIADELARVYESGFAMSLHSDIVVPYLASFGDDAQKKRWLPGCVSGELVTAIAMTEPGTGSDLAGIASTAVLDGDHYVLNGAKTFISNGQLCDLVIVAAKTDFDPKNAHGGISLFVVEAGTPGFVKGKRLKKMGMASQDTSEMFFESCRVPVANRLGDAGGGFVMLMQKLQQERLMVAIAAQSAAEQVVADTVVYTQERKAFGKPISKLQNTQFELVSCATDVEVGRAFLDKVVSEHAKGAYLVKECSMAKLWQTEMLCRVVDRCLQLFGGYGYMVEYPVTRAYMDARVQKIYAGTNEIMKVIIAKQMGL